jgi:hypothetical protein
VEHFFCTGFKTIAYSYKFLNGQTMVITFGQSKA